ncbi:hypothetical protein MAR_006121 [Mya arenaria]|uniref:Protein kinase domain-containing protein n=1 Tax=Mya arenaria TaxID=6604 RepID=A0ABY7DF52_MYAAR|nr:hypothetical protein MAR_006121 [Mya arenaria]
MPESESCYGAADIVIILTNRKSNGENEIRSFETPGTATYFYFLSLNPEVNYNLGLQIKTEGGTALNLGEDLSVVTLKEESPGGVSTSTETVVETTIVKESPEGVSTSTETVVGITSAKEESPGGIPTGAVVGIIVGIIVLCVLVVGVLFVLTRRGIINVQPQRRAVTKHVRQSRISAPEPLPRQSYENNVFVFDNRQNELNFYEKLDFNSSSKGYIRTDQISFGELLKRGHFANIYRAHYNRQNVVAKTLKEHFTSDDKLLMKAKINFSSERVGDHPNIIKFVGAVVDNVSSTTFKKKNI